MSADTRARKLSRAAASGDQQAEARLLLERVRAGRLSRERLELAAYCGHEGARAFVRDSDAGAPWDWFNVDSGAPGHFAAFLGGLSRWAADHAQLRAAVAAASAVLAEWDAPRIRSWEEPGGTGWERDRTRLAIAAANDWLACPCEEHRQAWAGHFATPRDAAFLPCPPTLPPETRITGYWIGHRGGSEGVRAHNERAPIEAARLLHEQPVREAICSALTRWALDGEA